MIESTGDHSQTWPASLDAMDAAPRHHDVLLENALIRVLDTRVAAGERTPVHTHALPSVLYVLSWSDFIRYDGDGNILVDSRGWGSRPGRGSTIWSEPLAPHSVENVGGNELRVITVEVKTKP